MAFKPSAAKKHASDEEGALNMNSMMDMMTIILLFLLKSYSTEGALITASEDLKLPESTRKDKPSKMVAVAVGNTAITVNDNVIASIKILSETEGNTIEPLAEKLATLAAAAKEDEANGASPFEHEIIIQGDANLPYEYFFKILYTCAGAEYYNMRILSVSNPGRK